VQNSVVDPEGLFLCQIFDCDLDGNGIPDPPDTVPFLQHPHGWYSTAVNDSDTDVSFSLGVLIMPWKQFSFGIVYNSDDDYSFVQRTQGGLTDALVAMGGPDLAPEGTINHALHLPSRLGVGFKWQPSQNWTVAADVLRVEYSNLAEDVVQRVNVVTSFPYDDGDQVDVTYTVDDVTEVRVGVEYLFTDARLPWAIRFGGRTDPDNLLREVGCYSLRDPDALCSFGDALGGRDDEVHVTAGAGLVLQEKLQLDFAVSFSSIGDEALMSLIYRF
jgi:hypothetical protein